MAARFVVLLAACIQISLAIPHGWRGHVAAPGSPAIYDYTNPWGTWNNIAPSWTTPTGTGSVLSWKTPAAFPTLPSSTGLPGNNWSVPASEAPWTTPAQAPNPIVAPTVSYSAPGQEIYWTSPAPFGIGNLPAPSPALPATLGHPWTSPAPLPAQIAFPSYATSTSSTPAGLGSSPAPAPAGLGSLPAPAPAGIGSFPVSAPSGLGAFPYSAPSGLGAFPYPAPSGLGALPYPASAGIGATNNCWCY